MGLRRWYDFHRRKPTPTHLRRRSDETTYTITLTAKNAAGTLSETFQQEVTVGTVGVVSPTANGGLQIYPNPVTDGQLHVELPQSAMVRLMDVAGRVLKTGSGAQLHFDLTSFGRGIYLLETTVDGRMETVKVVY